MRLTLLSLCFLLSVAIFAQSGSMEFTSSSTFTVPDGVTELFIEVVGAGGSGGYNGTGGGGGGGYASGNYAVTPGDVLNIIIGTPGGGAAVGTSMVEGFLGATGGENGVSVPNPNIGGGGAAGVGTGGNIANYIGGIGGGGYYTYFGGGGGGSAGPAGNGGDGGNTIAWTGICLTPGGDGGLSGGAPGGNGGKGAGFIDAFCGVSDPSAPGNNYGAGGGGGNGNGGGPGNGAGGYCHIKWCDINPGIISNLEYTLMAEQNDATYQWINCSDNSIISGATEQTYTVTQTGSYAVIVSDDVCTDTSECVDVTVIIESVDEMWQQAISIAPNPAKDLIYFETPAGSECTFAVFSQTGQMLWENNNAQQNISSLQTGMYLIRITSGNHIAWKMFAKE